MEKDCQDGSDEANCTKTDSSDTCGDDMLDCGTAPRQCLPLGWKCDGDKDCQNGSDEANCTAVTTCKDWQFRCGNGHCIFNTWRCDGDNDCADKTDEMNCTDVANNTDTHPAVPVPNFPTGDCNEWMFKVFSRIIEINQSTNRLISTSSTVQVGAVHPVLVEVRQCG